MLSDVPLGILLSGGIDSSTVAAFATQHATEKVKTFSIGFEEDSFDESKYARQVAKHLSTEHYEEKLSAEKAGDLITEIGTWLDEPLSDGSLIPTYLLARFVRKHVTVALGGDGGDELFAGYPMYYAHKVAGAIQRDPGVSACRSDRAGRQRSAGFDKQYVVRLQSKTLCPRGEIRHRRAASFVVRIVFDRRSTNELLPRRSATKPSDDIYRGVARAARHIRRQRRDRADAVCSTSISTWPRTF